MRFSEVIDTPEHVRDFMIDNKIKQDDIVGIIIVWDEDVE